MGFKDKLSASTGCAERARGGGFRGRGGLISVAVHLEVDRGADTKVSESFTLPEVGDGFPFDFSPSMSLSHPAGLEGPLANGLT